MGWIGTIATAGIGYAAGVMTARRTTPKPDDQASIDGRQIREIMTAAPDGVRPSDTVQRAAALMRANDIGDVLVEDDQGGLLGIVTDRDITVRATAEGSDPTTTTVEQVYTRDITVLSPTDSVNDAMQLMRAGDVRRLPVVERGTAIGIVSLGDVSVETKAGSVLADISAASPDR